MNVTNGKKAKGAILTLAMACLLLLVGCKGSQFPEEPLGKICTWDVPLGQHYAFKTSPGGPDSVRFVGRAYHASYDSTCTVLPDGPHPLVIVAHGRVLSEAPLNHLGMTYLTHHLASWGDIVFTVNLDGVDELQDKKTQWGIPHRAELVLYALEYMLAQNRTPGSPYYQRIDSTRIALVGHSRGGGAVISAANMNATGKRRPIRAIATLSPANFGTSALMAPVPHLCVYGTWDGDLFSGEGPDIWARGTRMAPRELVEVYGANHYYFTDKATFPVDYAEINREGHHMLAKGMINAWFDRYLREQDRFGWSAYLEGQRRIFPNLEYYVSYQNHRFLPVQNISPPQTADGSRYGRKLSSTTCEFCEVPLDSAPDYGAGRAVQATWDARNDHLLYEFPALKADSYKYLCFRASQVHGSPLNETDQRKDFNVAISDVYGHTAQVPAKAYMDGLQYPDLSGSLAPDDPQARKQIMRGFRIPLEDFAAVDFSQVTQIRFSFDRPKAKGFDNRSGVIKVADLEFSE